MFGYLWVGDHCQRPICQKIALLTRSTVLSYLLVKKTLECNFTDIHNYVITHCNRLETVILYFEHDGDGILVVSNAVKLEVLHLLPFSCLIDGIEDGFAIWEVVSMFEVSSLVVLVDVIQDNCPFVSKYRCRTKFKKNKMALWQAKVV